jgi:hypothetical protein
MYTKNFKNIVFKKYILLLLFVILLVSCWKEEVKNVNENTLNNEVNNLIDKTEKIDVNSFFCWDDIVLNWNKYTTKYAIDNQCWTTTNMKHQPTAWKSWCNECEKYGRLYDLEGANTLCSQLWDWWSLPSEEDWTEIKEAWNTKLIWSKLDSIWEIYAWEYNNSDGRYYSLNEIGTRWSYTDNVKKYAYSIVTGLEYIEHQWFIYGWNNGYSVICINSTVKNNINENEKKEFKITNNLKTIPDVDFKVDNGYYLKDGERVFFKDKEITKFIFTRWNEPWDGSIIKDPLFLKEWQSDWINQWQKNRSDSFNYCEKLVLWWKKDWRLPTKNELESILTDNIQYNYFTDSLGGYWSSTNAWLFDWYLTKYTVSFMNWIVKEIILETEMNVRCIRDSK